MKAKLSFRNMAIALIAMLFSFHLSTFAQTVTNGNFETWTGGNPDGWTLIPISNRVTFSQGTGEGFTGNALKIVGLQYSTSNEGEFYTIVNDITPGSYYRLSVKVKSNDDRIKIRFHGMKWLDAAGNQVGSDINENTYNANTSNAWIDFNLALNPIKAPANAVKLQAYFKVKNAVGVVSGSSTIWVDNFTVTLVNFVDPQRTANSVTQTSDNTGGSLNFAFSPSTYICNITQPAGQKVPWVSANGSFATFSGNWVGVAIDFPAGFTGASDIHSLKIDGVAQTGPFLGTDEINAGELWYYFEMNGQNNASHTLLINWDGQNNYENETFVINANNLSL